MTIHKLGLHRRIWLKLESQETPMHNAVLAKFAKTADDSALALYKKFVANNFAGGLWNKLINEAGQVREMHSPNGQDGFFIREQVFYSNLNQPAGEKELGELISRLHSEPLRTNKPRWEVHVIDDLYDQQFAVFVKIHKCLLESVNGLDLFLDMISENSQSGEPRPFWLHQETKSGGLNVSSKSTSIKHLLRGLILSFRDSAGVKKRFPVTKAPKSALNSPIDSARRVSTVTLGLEQLRDVAHRTDSDLSEIFTWLCGSALRRFFKEYNALPKRPFIGLVPVSIEDKTSQDESVTTAIRVSLATHIGDKQYRLESVKNSVAHVKRELSQVPEKAVPAFSLMRVAPLLLSQLPGVGRLLPRVYNLVVSHTPGVTRARYLNGNKLQEIYPFHSLLQNSGLSINSVTYNGCLHVGLVGSETNLPHIQRLSSYITLALNDLHEAIETGELSNATPD